MTLNGYDPLTGHSFTWDKEFKYAGRVNSPPGSSLSVKNGAEFRFAASLQGAYFLSGYREPAWVFYADTKERATLAIIDETGIFAVEQTEPRVGLTDRMILCGPKVADPAYVGAFCARFPCNPLYVCHLTDELPAFGILAHELVFRGLEKPRRVPLLHPITDDMPSVFQEEFDPKLNGDVYGRMALVLNRGFIAMNEVMAGPGLSFFYGRILSWKSVFNNPVYVLSFQTLQMFLPLAPISLKLYAATSVPVLAPVSDDFRKATGHEGDTAVIGVANDFIPGLGDFIHFHGAMGKSGIFCSGMILPSEITGNFPVFRYNKMHVTDAREYLEKR